MRTIFLEKLSKILIPSLMLLSCSCSITTEGKIQFEGKGVFLSNGFFINHEGYIATTSHSVSDKCKNLWLHVNNENHHIDTRDIVLNDSLSDFAVIKSNLKTNSPLEFSTPNRSATYMLSYRPSPLIKSPDKHLVSEIDSEPINLGTGRKFDVVKRIKTKTKRGMSGSPVFNDRNEIVGMIVRGIFNVDDMESGDVAMMIPVEPMIELLKKAEISPELGKASVNRNVELGLVQIICDPGM